MWKSKNWRNLSESKRKSNYKRNKLYSMKKELQQTVDHSEDWDIEEADVDNALEIKNLNFNIKKITSR